MPKTIKLNIGAGKTRYKGYLNVDKIDWGHTDVVFNLENAPLPFKDNSVSEVLAEHVLEHISNYMQLMEELHRICKKGALIRINVPYYKYEGAFRDPTHVRFFSERSFDYFEDNFEYGYYTKARFKTIKAELKTTSKTTTYSQPKTAMKFVPFRRFFSNFLWNCYTEIYFEIEVLK